MSDHGRVGEENQQNTDSNSSQQSGENGQSQLSDVAKDDALELASARPSWLPPSGYEEDEEGEDEDDGRASTLAETADTVKTMSPRERGAGSKVAHRSGAEARYVSTGRYVMKDTVSGLIDKRTRSLGVSYGNGASSGYQTGRAIGTPVYEVMSLTGAKATAKQVGPAGSSASSAQTSCYPAQNGLILPQYLGVSLGVRNLITHGGYTHLIHTKDDSRHFREESRCYSSNCHER